jgi:hypothetical protein
VSEDLTCTEARETMTTNAISGIVDVGAAAAEGRGRALVVEDGFHSPETDAAIAKVVRHNGEVIVVRNGDITDLGRVALLLRY